MIPRALIIVSSSPGLLLRYVLPRVIDRHILPELHALRSEHLWPSPQALSTDQLRTKNLEKWVDKLTN